MHASFAATTLLMITLAGCSSTTTPSPSPSVDAATDAASGDAGDSKCAAAGHFCAAPDGSCPAGYSPVGALELSCAPVSPNCCIQTGSADAGKD